MMQPLRNHRRPVLLPPWKLWAPGGQMRKNKRNRNIFVTWLVACHIEHDRETKDQPRIQARTRGAVGRRGTAAAAAHREVVFEIARENTKLLEELAALAQIGDLNLLGLALDKGAHDLCVSHRGSEWQRQKQDFFRKSGIDWRKSSKTIKEHTHLLHLILLLGRVRIIVDRAAIRQRVVHRQLLRSENALQHE
jgi:hypothetical protein